MFWKNWPYWLKGGIITGVFGVIFVYLILASHSEKEILGESGGFFFVIILSALQTLIVGGLLRYSCRPEIFGSTCNAPAIIQLVSDIFVIFVIAFMPGVILGLIYGAIKKRSPKGLIIALVFVVCILVLWFLYKFFLGLR